MDGPRSRAPIGPLVVACSGALVGGLACRSSSEAPAPAAHRAPPVSAEGSPTDATQVHRVGDTAETGTYRLTVRSTRSCTTEPYFRPRPGNVRLGVSITLANSGSHTLTVNPFYARLKDPDGKYYYFTLAGCEPILDATRLEPGKTTEGWLTFDIPIALRKVELVYHPLDAASESQSTRFELELDDW